MRNENGAGGIDSTCAYTQLARGDARVEAQCRSELPLILFTLLCSASVGVVGAAIPLRLISSVSVWLPALCLVLVFVGMVASVVHLAKPLRAPTSLRNLASSWLSREILIVFAYWGSLAVWLYALVIGLSSVAVVLNLVSLALGICLVLAMARAYKVHAQPLWFGPESSWELFACSLGVGIPLALAFSGDALPVLITYVLACAAMLGAATLYMHADTHRALRVANPETPREHAALDRLNELVARRGRVLALLTLASFTCLLLAALALFVDYLSSSGLIVPCGVSVIAFYFARDRFYEMAVLCRPAVLRRMR